MNTDTANVCAPDPGYHEGYKWALLNLDQEGVQADRARFMEQEIVGLRTALQEGRDEFHALLKRFEDAQKERDHLRIRVKQVEAAHGVAERLREEAEKRERDDCGVPHLGYATNTNLVRELAARYASGYTDPEYRTASARR